MACAKVYAVRQVVRFISEQVCLSFIRHPYTTNQLNFTASLPVGQHVLDVAVVLCVQVLWELLLGQPLEVLKVLSVDGEVGLATHNAGLKEEDLVAGGIDLGGFPLLRAGCVELVPSNGVVADHPGVHVDTGGIGKGTLGSLSVGFVNNNKVSIKSRFKVLNSPGGGSLPSPRGKWGTSSFLPWIAQGDRECGIAGG